MPRNARSGLANMVAPNALRSNAASGEPFTLATTVSGLSLAISSGDSNGILAWSRPRSVRSATAAGRTKSAAAHHRLRLDRIEAATTHHRLSLDRIKTVVII